AVAGVGLRLSQARRGDGRLASGGHRREDGVAHGGQVGELLHAGEDGDERGVGGGGGVGGEAVDALFGLDQAAVEVGGAAEVEVEQRVEGGVVLVRLGEGGAVEGEGEPGKGGTGPGHVGGDGGARVGLARDVDGRRGARRPGAPVAL